MWLFELLSRKHTADAFSAGPQFSTPRANRPAAYFPREAFRSGALSLIVVIALIFLVEKVGFPFLERHNLTTGENWSLHNSAVQHNLAIKDRTQKKSVRNVNRDAVRSWTGQRVTPARTIRPRILVMGDSFIWGSPYYSINHMWWRQLEIELHQRGWTSVEVIAAGQSGASTRQELDLARLVIPEYQPDLVIWGYVVNDPDEGLVLQPSSPLAVPWASISKGHRLSVVWYAPFVPVFHGRGLLLDTVPRLWTSLEIARNNAAVREIENVAVSWEQRLLEGANFSRYRQTMAEVGEFVQSTNLPQLMVTLPNVPDLETFSRLYERVLPLWREAKIPVLDLLPAEVAQFGNARMANSSGLVWGINPADGHPGPRLCHFYAQQVADWLEINHRQLLGRKVAQPKIEPVINDWLPATLNVELADALAGNWALNYPADDSLMPGMPLPKPTAAVMLAEPVALSEIEFRSEGMKSAQAWVQFLDPAEGYDEEKPQALESGTLGRFRVPLEFANRKISLIRFRIDLTGSVRLVRLRLLTDSPPAN